MIKNTGLDKEIQGAQSQLSAFPYSAAQPALWQEE